MSQKNTLCRAIASLFFGAAIFATAATPCLGQGTATEGSNAFDPAMFRGRTVSADIYCDHPTDMATMLEYATRGQTIAVKQFLSPHSSSCHSRVRDMGERLHGTVVGIIGHVVGTREREAWLVKVVLGGKHAGRVVYSYLGIDDWESIGRPA